MKEWIIPIAKMNPCSDALVWAENYDSLTDAWAACERGDWMLWILGKTAGSPRSESRKKLVLVACQCARLGLPYVAKGEVRPLRAIETTEAWARGEGHVTLKDVKNAAAYAAACAADAAHAATTAAYAATAAAYAAAHAAYAADAAAYAAAYAAACDFGVLKRCADIVRGHYTRPVLRGKRIEREERGNEPYSRKVSNMR